MSFGVSVTRKGKGFQRASKAAEKGMDHALEDATLALHRHAVRGIMKQSQGEKQTRYSPKRSVTASKPGDPPNVDTGVFVKSVKFEFRDDSGFVGTNDKRGPWLEFGTKNMAARPWLSSAVVSARREMQKIFKKMKIKL